LSYYANKQTDKQTENGVNT